jgi:hypothetical protein
MKYQLNDDFTTRYVYNLLTGRTRQILPNLALSGIQLEWQRAPVTLLAQPFLQELKQSI